MQRSSLAHTSSIAYCQLYYCVYLPQHDIPQLLSHNSTHFRELIRPPDAILGFLTLILCPLRLHCYSCKVCADVCGKKVFCSPKPQRRTLLTHSEKYLPHKIVTSGCQHFLFDKIYCQACIFLGLKPNI